VLPDAPVPEGRTLRRSQRREEASGNIMPVTNLLERLFGEERRRTKVIPHAFGERAVLKLMYASLIRAGQTWRKVVIGEFELKQIDELQRTLDEEFKQRTATAVSSASRQRIYSRDRT
jgi:transposase-like protein